MKNRKTEKQAKEYVLNEANIEPSDENILYYQQMGYLAIHEHNGNTYCWLLDESNDICIDISTMEHVDPELIGLC